MQKLAHLDEKKTRPKKSLRLVMQATLQLNSDKTEKINWTSMSTLGQFQALSGASK